MKIAATIVLAAILMISSLTSFATPGAPAVVPEQAGHPEKLTDTFGKDTADAIIDSYGTPARGYTDLTNEPYTPGTEKVSYLYWFKEAVERFVPDTEFGLYDLNTGLRVQMKVVDAGNHADIVPVTQEDADFLRESFIAGSKTIRPVIVIFENRQYAAALDPQSDVDAQFVDFFDGVMSLYFSDSTAEDTDTVDPVHRDSILEAYTRGNE